MASGKIERIGAALAEIARDEGEAVACVGSNAAHHGAFVPPDELDDLAALMLPETVAKRPLELARAEAEALFREGLRGKKNVGRSLVSKDISASRMHVRYYQARLDAEISLLGRGRGNLKIARFLSDLVDRQHRRMVASCDLLLRLDAVPTPSFRVQADQAAFVVGGPANSPNNDNG